MAKIVKFNINDKFVNKINRYFFNREPILLFDMNKIPSLRYITLMKKNKKDIYKIKNKSTILSNFVIIITTFQKKFILYNCDDFINRFPNDILVYLYKFDSLQILNDIGHLDIEEGNIKLSYGKSHNKTKTFKSNDFLNQFIDLLHFKQENNTLNKVINNTIKLKKKKEEKRLILTDLNIKETYEQLKSIHNNYDTIYLTNIKVPYSSIFWIMTNKSSIYKVIKNILRDENIKKIDIKNSEIFYNGKLVFFKIRKETIFISNCDIKEIIIYSNDIQIKNFKIVQKNLNEEVILVLQDLKRIGKIKKLVILSD